jgi:hypothetical protein
MIHLSVRHTALEQLIRRTAMYGTPLSRYAGPIILIAGGYIAVTHVALLVVLSRGELPALAADPLFRAVSLAYAAAFAGLLLALFAAYVRQAPEAGRFGLMALFGAILGTFALGADMWFEGFASPWLVEVSPQVLTAEKSTFWVAGYLSSYILFALGWALFGIASLRARVFPVPIGIALTIGGVFGFLAAAPPWGAVVGLALTWLGGWLIKAERTVLTIPEPATVPSG